MKTKIKVRNTYNLNLDGAPSDSIENLPESAEYVINPLRIDNFKAKLLVKEGDTVKIGTPLFTDKKQLHVEFLSPAAGTIKRIELGHRRVINRIIIEKASSEETIQLFDSYNKESISGLSSETVRECLMKGGLWASLKEYPFKNIPKQSTIPPAIYVSLEYDEPHMPSSKVILNEYASEFAVGIDVLKQLTTNVYVSHSDKHPVEQDNIKNLITHEIEGDYPANDPGIFLYYNKTKVSDNNSWGIQALDVIRIGQLFLSGTYPIERLMVIAGPLAKQPRHIKTREGTALSFIENEATQSEPTRIICGGVLTGKKAEIIDGIGYGDSAINIIREGQEQEMLTFFRPGFNKPTFSNTYLSAVTKSTKWAMTSSINGGHRACISCGLCTKVCPVDSSPQMIMKSLKDNDVETAVEYGLLDIVESGLYTYVCPSKIELDQIFIDAKKQLAKGLSE